MTGKASNAIQMAIHTLVNSNLEKLMERASILGRMAKCTMVSGTKESNRATVYGKASKTILTSASGLPRKLTGTACITGPMATGMKANGRCVSSMVKALIALQMEMYTQAHTLTVSPMARANTFGPPAKSTQVTLLVVRNTVKASGEAQGTFKTVIFMKVSTKTIVSTAKVSSRGPVVTSTKVITTRMSVKAMAKCFGQMEACTKVSGLAASSMAWVA